MSVILDSTLLSDLQSFSDLYGEEISDCNPNAHDLLMQVITSGDPKLLDDFVWYHLDELEACHPDAFDMMYDLAQHHGIKL